MAEPKTAPLEPKIIDRLLDLLSDSDKFRELFQSAPAAALELIGHQEPTALQSLAADSIAAEDTGLVAISGCLAVAELASKETIQAAREDLKSMLLQGLSHTTPQLDASLSESRRPLK